MPKIIKILLVWIISNDWTLLSDEEQTGSSEAATLKTEA